jgi:hypothetical protein
MVSEKKRNWSKAGTSILFGPWSMGASVLFYDEPFDPRKRLELLERYRITVSCAAASAIGQNRPSLCEKSDQNETVGKLCTFPLRLAMKQDEEWDCASKSGGFVSIFPTGNMTPDFSHTLGHFRILVILCSGSPRARPADALRARFSATTFHRRW